MQEDSQFEITKALVTLMICAVFSTIGGDIGSGMSFNLGTGVTQATLPGLLIGMISGAILVNFIMKDPHSPTNLS